ncbi:MAG TPA: proline dehydrogenase, partial [Gemmatimonadaceae bacterium]|nr:proline dehydrogenase [Gemmatimonadaceae bacterium]
MLRDTLLYLSNQPRVFKFVRKSRLARHFAKRFVPGETLDDALEVVRGLNGRGISASLDLLGESVTNEREARAARDEYLQMLDRIHQFRLEA